jgi:hypothetical protein
MAKVVLHWNGELELLVRRVQYPGKNTGWLGVGEKSNVWLIVRNYGYWICDCSDAASSTNAQLVQTACDVMHSCGSMEQGFKNAAAGLRDGRAGYPVIDVSDVDVTDRLAVAKVVEKVLLTDWLHSQKQKGGTNA